MNSDLQCSCKHAFSELSRMSVPWDGNSRDLVGEQDSVRNVGGGVPAARPPRYHRPHCLFVLLVLQRQDCTSLTLDGKAPRVPQVICLLKLPIVLLVVA